MKRADLFFNVLRLPVDLAMILGAGVATYFLRTRILDTFRPALFTFDLSLATYFSLVLVVAAVFIVCYAISGLYSMAGRMSLVQESARVVVASSAGILTVIIYIFLRQELFNSRFLVLGGWLLATGFVIVGRLIARGVQAYAVSRYRFGIHKVMIIGQDSLSAKIRSALENDKSWGYEVVKYLPNPQVSEVKLAVGNPGVDEVILTNPHYPAQSIVELVDFCHENHITFKFVPNIYETLTTNFSVEAIGSVPVIELRRTSLDGWGKVFKRIVDVIFSLLAVIILAPLFALIALAIKWETAGPVLVRLRRVSRNQEFNLLKFRSMIENAEQLKPLLAGLNERHDGPLFKIKDDPRVTRVGRFLRRYRLDELPQFFNVLGGDISIVGPRPHQPDEITQYEKHHKKVLAIKAGATGLAQISGSSDLTFEDEVTLDTFYIENWNMMMDLRLMFKTALKMLRDNSAV